MKVPKTKWKTRKDRARALGRVVTGVVIVGVAVWTGCGGGSGNPGHDDSKAEVTRQDYPSLVLDDVYDDSTRPDLGPRPRAVVALPGESSEDVGQQRMSGQLDANDSRLGDGSFADYHAYVGQAGERLRVDLSSVEFVPYVIFGRGPSDGFEWLAEAGGSGGSVRLDIVLPADGTYTIVANSSLPGQSGSYTLTVENVGAADFLQTGRTASGTLEATDFVLEHDRTSYRTYYEPWLFEGRAGERFEITLRSDDFDPYLLVASGTPGNLQYVQEDDDGADGDDSLVRIRVAEDGVYTVLVNSYGAEETGAYTLDFTQIESAPDYVTRYPADGPPDARYALLVGLDDYPGNANDLPSSVADVQIMRDLLVDTYGYNPDHVVTIVDDEATRDHIFAALERHLGQAGPSGTALFYYSGHGLQLDSNLGLADPFDPEPGDDRDEALYVYGYDDTAGILLDDDLGYAIDQLSTQRTLVILDSCHSGTASRGGVMSKFVSLNPTDIGNVSDRLYLPRRFPSMAGAAQAMPSEIQGGLLDLVFSTPHLLLAASRDDETSLPEVGWPDRGGVASVFTYYLVGGLESVEPRTTFEELMGSVRDQTSRYARERWNHSQTPQISGDLAGMSVYDFLMNR